MSTGQQYNNKHCILMPSIVFIDCLKIFQKNTYKWFTDFPWDYWYLCQLTQMRHVIKDQRKPAKWICMFSYLCHCFYCYYCELFLQKGRTIWAAVTERWGFTSLHSLYAPLSKASQFSAEICWFCSFPPLRPMSRKKLLEKNLTYIYWLPPLR